MAEMEAFSEFTEATVTFGDGDDNYDEYGDSDYSGGAPVVANDVVVG